MTRASVLLIATASFVLGCGSSGSDAGGLGGGPGAGGDGGPPGAGADGSVPGADGGGPGNDGGPVPGQFGFRHLLAPLSTQTGHVNAASRTLVSFPQALSASLAGLTTVVIEDKKATVATVPVTGMVPAGEVEGFGWASALNKYVVVVYAKNPWRIDVATVALTKDLATFELQKPVSPPDANGAIVSAIYSVGGGVIAVRGDQFIPLTFSGGQVTWGAPVAPQQQIIPSSVMFDEAGGRLVGFGAMVFDPPMSVKYHGGVYQLPLGGGFLWTEIPMTGGSAPPDVTGNQGSSMFPWAAWDAAGSRVVAVQLHEVTDPPPIGTHMINGLWSATVPGPWSLVSSQYFGYPQGSTAYAIDQAGRRAFDPRNGMATYGLAPGSEGTTGSLTADGALPPAFPVAATHLGDGRVVMSDQNGALVTLDPGKPRARWEALGPATIPAAVKAGHSLSLDPTSGKLLVFGGADATGAGSSSLYEITADGSTVTPITAPNGPSARSRHAALVAGGSLFVVGGAIGTPTPAAKDDVWAFDLKTRAWRSVGKLPAARQAPGLFANDAGELVVVGGMTYVGTTWQAVTSVVAIDPKTGATRELTVHGDWPPRKGIFWCWAPLGKGLAVVDSGDTVDASGNELWRLEPDGDGVKWTGTDAQSHDYAFYSVVGTAGADPTRAYFVGSNTWELYH